MSKDIERSNPSHNEKKSVPKNSMTRYLTILLAAALLLLLLAYFMQQRANEETIGNLAESITSIESLNDLIAENKELREQLKETEEALKESEAQLENSISNQLYDDLGRAYKEAADFQSLTATIHTAEHLVHEKQYAEAQALLDDWDTEFLEKTIASYDARQADNNIGEEHLIAPCYEALRDTLSEQLGNET